MHSFTYVPILSNNNNLLSILWNKIGDSYVYHPSARVFIHYFLRWLRIRSTLLSSFPFLFLFFLSFPSSSFLFCIPFLYLLFLSMNKIYISEPSLPSNYHKELVCIIIIIIIFYNLLFHVLLCQPFVVTRGE